ncbi:MAG: hypothetical protein RR144_03210 [Clostridia bacterium]
MDVIFVYKLDEKEYGELVKNIENKFKEYITELSVKITVKDKLNIRNKADVYIIISSDIEEVQNYSKSIKDKSKILILTENLSSSYIIKSVEITKNICYLKNEIDYI